MSINIHTLTINPHAHTRHPGLAGNPLSDFRQLSLLSPPALPSLRCLSLSDIHFGRCPLADDEGYRAFVVTALTQVCVCLLCVVYVCVCAGGLGGGGVRVGEWFCECLHT